MIGSSVDVTGLAIDPDSGDTVTYSLTNSAGGLFAIDPNTGVVTVAAGLDYETATSHLIDVAASSTDGSSNTATFTIDVLNVNDAVINSTNMFYAGSGFASGGDFGAVATDKQPLLPGETATFANYTSYSLGINGLAFELNDTNVIPTSFQRSAMLVTSSRSMLEIKTPLTAGPRHLHRLTSFMNQTLTRLALIEFLFHGPITQFKISGCKITVLANASTGLADPEVFYFGNSIGETGNDSSNARVNLVDVALSRANQSGFNTVEIDNHYDVNRDERVNLVDVAIIRANQTGFSSLALIHHQHLAQGPPGSAPIRSPAARSRIRLSNSQTSIRRSQTQLVNLVQEEWTTEDEMRQNIRRHHHSPWTEFSAQFSNGNKHKIWEYSLHLLRQYCRAATPPSFLEVSDS